jgi:hypothetical protein
VPLVLLLFEIKKGGLTYEKEGLRRGELSMS